MEMRKEKNTKHEIRNTKYEFILMSNTERRLKNEEGWIRVLIQMVLLRVLGTWYFACLPQASTLYSTY